MAANLRANPFFLDDTQIDWVNRTRDGMTLREKVGQLICCVSPGDSCEELLSRYREIPYGGITFRVAPAKQIKERVDFIQSQVKIPLLVSANLENGGCGVASDGTDFASQLEVAATNDPAYAEALGEVCGAEGAAIGVNYTFAPVVDIHYNWRNAIINTRTYGSDPNRVLDFSRAYLRGVSAYNMAVSIKHFPGDGVDERDQHLLSSVNSLSCEEWDASYGRVYQTLINEGAQTVMVGHILLPSYSRRLRPGIADPDIRPASIAPELVTGLLREKLGFNGMVITDSAVMTGLGCSLPRREIPAACINAGCDMFLFGRNLEEDFESLLADAASGVIPAQRLDEAVTRVLALKASLGLNRKTKFTSDDYAKTVGSQRFRDMAYRCADQAITLVKDTQHLLPVTPATHKRIWLHILGDNPAFRGGSRCKERIIDALEAEGFQVTCLEGEELEETFSVPVRELKTRFDLILYVANVVTGGNNTVNRLCFVPRACGESAQYVRDIPTVFVSLGDPYHFVDMPMIQTFINCYNNSDATVHCLMEKLTGRSPFRGASPVDPFCGVWGAQL